ncbi:MAG: diguanylate cyclase [Aliihoeflea sp.]
MQSYRRIGGYAVLAVILCVLCVNSIAFFRSLDRLMEASENVAHTQQTRDLLAAFMMAVLNAETGQRGYLMTSDSQYLAPYHNAYRSVDPAALALTAHLADDPTLREPAVRMRQLAKQKLSEMASAISTHTREGSEASRRYVATHQGRTVMNEIRDQSRIIQLELDLRMARNAVAYDSQKIAIQTAAWVFTGAGIGLVLFVYVMMRREIHRRSAAAQEIASYAETLDRGKQLIERERNEIARLNEASNFLQSCNSMDEVAALSTNLLAGLFPGRQGALWIYAASRNRLTTLAAFGGAPVDSSLAPEDCWGLRRGQIHETAAGGSAPCCDHHLTHPELGLCIPLIAHGETLGLLTLDGTDGLGADMDALRRLAEMVARQLGLTLANLRMRETLKEQSIRDPLTGVFNRRYLEAVAAKEIAHANRSGRPLAVAMLDVDHFKRFNDLHGHGAGDAALVAVCGYLKANMREGDWIFRYGGEEFVLLLRDADHADAEAKIAELREGISAISLELGGNSLPSITASIGVAVFPDHGMTMDALLEGADAALYEAKSGGRNRVSFAPELVAA